MIWLEVFQVGFVPIHFQIGRIQVGKYSPQTAPVKSNATVATVATMKLEIALNGRLLKEILYHTDIAS